MIDALKSEFRKLLTVRSTYFNSAAAIVLVCFFFFYVVGFKANPADLLSPDWLAGNFSNGVANLAIFCSIIAILLMSHEYRYNTIIYTLTSANNRSKVLLAKALTISAYAVVFVLVIGGLGALAAYLGAQAKGLELAPQVIHGGDVLWRTLFFGWSSGMVAFILAVLIRSQVGAIVALFLLPTLEQLLSLLLKENTIYLPFMAQTTVLSTPRPGVGMLSPGDAALLFSVYLAVSGIVAWLLFMRRDAN